MHETIVRQRDRAARALALIVLALHCGGESLHADEPIDFPARRAAADARFAAQLGGLAQWCRSQQLAPQAELTQSWLPKRDPHKLYVCSIPESDAPPSSLVNSPAAQSWWDRFVQLRADRAAELFDLAQSAAQAKQASLAYELARETLRENPSHAQARAALGFVEYEQRWLMPETVRRLRAGKVWSDQFGWLPAGHLPRYEQGLRYYRANWIDADDEARLRANIRNGWRVETEHYVVTTNVSLQEGVRLSGQLEMLYEVWRQAFLEYFVSAEEVERWFRAGSGSRGTAARKPHQVVYFRNKQEYVDALRPVQPQIEISLGTYIDSAKTAYFFAGDEQYDGTLYHEAAHQLFRELRPGSIDPGRNNNFWIVEAIACYMESLAEHRPLAGEPYGAYFTVGGLNEGRVPAARQRAAIDQFYVPLSQLTPLGMQSLQRDPRLPKIYSQSAGLAQFFMHADQARYRPILLQYLVAVYTGRAAPATLHRLSETSYEQLDQRYLEYIR